MAVWTNSGDYSVAGTSYSNPALGSLAGGGYVSAWLQGVEWQGGAGLMIVAQRFDADGFKVGAELVLNEQPLLAAMFAPHIALKGTADGGFVASWTADENLTGGHFVSPADIYVRRFDENGAATGAPALVNEPPQRTLGNGYGASQVTELSNGNFIVSWTASFQLDDPLPAPSTPLLRFYDAGGAPLGDAMPHGGGTLFPIAGVGFIAVGYKGDANSNKWFEYQLFGMSGEPLSDPAFAFPLGDWDVASATILASGELLMVRLTKDLATGTQELSVVRHDINTGEDHVSILALPDTNSDHIPEAISSVMPVALTDGGFVLTWLQSANNTHEIFAQHFDAAAQPVGEPMPVNDVPISASYARYTAAAAGEGVIVSWAASDFNAYSERLGPNVTPGIPPDLSQEISHLYVAMFGRAPDGEGLSFWAGLLRGFASTSSVANMMLKTEPAREYYPDLQPDQLVTSFYVNVLGRQPDAEGLAFWAARIDPPEVALTSPFTGRSPGFVIGEIISVAANYTGTDPAGLESAALFQNRTAVAQYYAEHNASVEAATHALDGVTSSYTTVADAIARIELVGTSAFASVDAYY